MAVDEALLKSANDSGQVTLRFYQWAAPTLSLGYFQKATDRALHSASVDCVMVRRSSGGGAILHDQELTYSLSLPGTNRWSSKQNDLYGSVHEAIVNYLRQCGVAAGQFAFPDPPYKVDENADEGVDRDTDRDTSAGRMNAGNGHRFLCFERRTAGDIVLDGYKIGGSAQRRLSGATLQHGSLLLMRSPYAPELPGLSELAKAEPQRGTFLEGMVAAIATGLNLSLKSTSLSAQQKKNAETILEQKYGNTDWTYKR
jgi:lipoate-protein ligase A